MSTYVWTLVVLMVLEVIAKGYNLGRGELVARTRAGTALDLIFIVALLVWGVYELATAP